MMIYNVSELSLNDATDRVKADRELTEGLFKCVTLDFDAERDLEGKPFRRGAAKDNPTTNPRPVLVSTKDHQINLNLFKKLEHTGSANNLYKKLSIYDDMTKQEKARHRDLFPESKATEANKSSREYIYRVLGPPWDLKIKKIIKKLVNKKSNVI